MRTFMQRRIDHWPAGDCAQSPRGGPRYGDQPSGL